MIEKKRLEREHKELLLRKRALENETAEHEFEELSLGKTTRENEATDDAYCVKPNGGCVV
jgi:hypothetical protein